VQAVGRVVPRRLLVWSEEAWWGDFTCHAKRSDLAFETRMTDKRPAPMIACIGDRVMVRDEDASPVMASILRLFEVYEK
jgi:hypothetical protein